MKLKMLWLWATLLTFVVTVRAAATNTFDKPDFAYPQTVIDHALPKLEGASPADKVKAALQITIAANAVTPSDAGIRAAMLDSLAATLPQPFASITYLLEAQLYADIYENNSWQYNRRTLPINGEWPADPLEWSGLMFKTRIRELADKAVADIDRLNDTPISTIAMLLTPAEAKYVATYPTVGAFVTSQMAELASADATSGRRIPFGEKVSSDSPLAWVTDLIDRQIAANLKAGRMAAAVEFTLSRSGYESNPGAYLIKQYRSAYSSVPEGVRLLCAQNGDASDLQLYRLLTDAATRYKDSTYGKMARNALSYIEAKTVNINGKQQYLSTDSIRVTISADNTQRAWLLLYKIPYDLKVTKVANILSKGTPVSATAVEMPGTIPFTATDTVALPNPGFGRYAVLVSSSANASGILDKGKNDRAMILTVSDLELITSDNGTRNRLYVADGHNLAPVNGATLTFTDRSREAKTIVKTTGKEGYVDTPEGGWSVVVTTPCGDRLASDTWFHTTKSTPANRVLTARVLTDLAIYHPADTVGFGAVIYNVQGRQATLAPDSHVTALLRDANWQVTDSLTLTADGHGRISGHFVIPADRLAGRWGVEICDSQRSIGSGAFQVADYKTPTFFVDINDITGSSDINITGQAMTYAGMPVADAEVKYTVGYARSWWWRGDESATYDGTATTGSDGRFAITLPTAGLKGTIYEQGLFTINVDVTSPSGETQSARPKMFHLGEEYTIDTSAKPGTLKVDSADVSFTIPVIDIAGSPVVRTIGYTITGQRTGTRLDGSFTSPRLVIPAADLPSDRYTLRLTTDSDTVISAPVVIFRDTDRTAPYATPLWVPQKQFVAEKGAGSINIPFATGYANSAVLCVVSDCNGTIREEWLYPSTDMQHIKVATPSADNRVWVRLTAGHNLNIQSETISILPSTANDSLKVSSVSFRDHIAPGDAEHWRFAVKYNGKKASGLPVMAVMTDKALNSIVPFEWSLNLRGSIWYNNPASISLPSVYSTSSSARLSSATRYSIPPTFTPDWNYYGQSLYSQYGNIRTRKFMAMADGAPAPNAMMKEEAVEEEMAVATSGVLMDTAAGIDTSANGGASPDVTGITLSDAQHPLAFFLPSLTTDADGNVTIDFTAPQFSTTWQLQLATYNDDLLSAVAKYDIVSARPVMVKATYPRFLRTGDNAQISASLMNNTDAPQPISGVIEFFDPATDKVLQRTDFTAEEVAPKATRTVTAEFAVTDSYPIVGIRCYALGSDHNDGEQDLIGILPSSTPVTDASTFYIGTSENGKTFRLPKFDKNANVTLRYCDNPVWYCVTALPDIASTESASIFAKLDMLFGNATANALARRYPQIGQAIGYWKQHNDPMLISNLAANADLNATPWVNNAAAETMRMQRLSSILDTDESTKVINSLITDIASLQDKEGAWSWTPVTPSMYVTSSVLLDMAWLKEMNALPQAVEQTDMIARAVKWCDTQFYDEYVRNKKQVSLISALNWLYIRKFFDIKPASSAIASSLERGLAKVEKDWRDLDIYGKATAALLLDGNGRKNVAADILESLRQLAVTTPASGMYYDNIGSGWNGYTRLQTTAQVLNAFAAIAPSDPAVDALRQWLILQRQVQDWGYSRHTAAVVQAILTSGSQWLDSPQKATVTLGGKQVVTSADPYTGQCTVNLNPAQASGQTLSVVRAGNQPAWGGVVAQYVAPIDQIKAAAVDQLSITKQIIPVTSPDAPLRKGDKVRVTLTVKCDRDLQYIEIADERGACLEPADQLSAYTVSDGVRLYREVTDTSTNLYIDFLPKGVHTISYECWIDREGTYTAGIATARSLYTPLVTAHSAGEIITVK